MMEMSVLWTLSLVYDQTILFPLSMQFKSRLRRDHNSCLSPRVKRFRWEQHRLCGQTAAVASLCTQPVYTVDAQQRHTLWHCKQYYMEYTANVMDAWTWWKVDRYFRRTTLLIDDIYRNHKIKRFMRVKNLCHRFKHTTMREILFTACNEKINDETCSHSDVLIRSTWIDLIPFVVFG